MQLFTTIYYNGMDVQYWAPKERHEGYIWNIVALKNGEFKGERKFKQMDIKNGYVGTFDEIEKEGMNLVNLLISQGK
jgi:hypothetical protein